MLGVDPKANFVAPKIHRSKLQKHVHTLVWKSHVQRQRRWRLLVLENVFAFILFLTAVFIARPTFLTTLEDEPEPPVSSEEILRSLEPTTIVGYAPDEEPFKSIMRKAAELLNIGPSDVLVAMNEKSLNMNLYKKATGMRIKNNVTWILWDKKKNDSVYRFRIRSTELARMHEGDNNYTKGSYDSKERRNAHLQAGFLAIQLAVSHALLEHEAAAKNKSVSYTLKLLAMPESPLMNEREVRNVIARILMCYTVAMLPPVLETEALVVTETTRRFKRALRIRSVGYVTMYLGWLAYALMTAVPICLLGSLALILIFRWIHLFYAFMTLLLYFLVMMMLALIMALAHSEALISCIWTISQTLLQTFLAELMVQHHYDNLSFALNFIIQMFMPPLGLLNGFNQFALIQTGQMSRVLVAPEFTVLSWVMLIMFYFLLLMLLQRTVGTAAIGGQVSWKSIIFKRAVDPNTLRPVANPRPLDVERLQQVDDLTAKAISFRKVSKTIMNAPILSDITFDIYRGEYSIIVSERIQATAMNCVADLLTGLTHADSGSINVLGVELNPHRNLMTEPFMMGYCDQSSFLIDDLTVSEHFTLYAEICLWGFSSQKIQEYAMVRALQLKRECDLEGLEDKRIRELGPYYRAQLCWAIAVLIEPRVVIVPFFQENPVFENVMIDKFLRYRKLMTIVCITLSSMNLVHADRLFLIDNRVFAFGGSPAYMFFRYGREYRLRLTIRTASPGDQSMKLLRERLEKAQAKIRAHTGSLLIVRLATRPSNVVANLLEDLEEHAEQYGILSTYVSLPDPEEVFRRVIHKSRSANTVPKEIQVRSEEALGRLTERGWSRSSPCFRLHLRIIAWKYFACYIRYRFFFIITILMSVLAGLTIGYDLGVMVREFDNINRSEIMTVEAMEGQTVLALRLDSSDEAMSIAQAYLISTTHSTEAQANKIEYIAVQHPQSLKELLATKAIDSPQDYVHLYAYGMDVSIDEDTALQVSALYSPVHRDHSAAARSLARVYMALLRYYTGNMTSAIEITDEPLLSENWANLADRALLMQFLLVLTISHMALVPSKEYGRIRHMQEHAMNFSPVGYWLSLAVCDCIHYWILTIIACAAGFVVFFYMTWPLHISSYFDLMIVPLMMMIHGVGCVPQAYLFSLGKRPSLNTMALIITNIVFGEATILANLFYGYVYQQALNFMSISPQFNMALALLKIKKVFQHNNECYVFKTHDLCSKRMLHRCCPSCGVLEECSRRSSYLWAVYPEIAGTLAAAVLFMSLLLLWDYRLIQLISLAFLRKANETFKLGPRPSTSPTLQKGVQREISEALEKENQLKHKRAYRGKPKSTFGEYLLAVNVSKADKGQYFVRNVYLGLSKGESVAVAGLKAHGRLHLCEVLSGYLSHDYGRLYAMSKHTTQASPHEFARNVSLCVEGETLPGWLTVRDALAMTAVLRGVPWRYVANEVTNFVEALDLTDLAGLLICHLRANEHRRLNFAAAVVGAPPILALDECAAYQNSVVRSAMNQILHLLRKRGHAILTCGFDVESLLPLTNRLAILRNGSIFDIDYVDNLLARYSRKGYIVVVHFKDEVNAMEMFLKYFDSCYINDVSDVLVNMQVLDDISWAEIFQTMELLQEENEQVYSYIVAAKPIAYIYQNIIAKDSGCETVEETSCKTWIRNTFLTGPVRVINPSQETVNDLETFQTKYELTKLNQLPWSVIFHR